MDIKIKLTEMLQSHSSGPFLFVGSGFSRRYLNLEDWEGLLSKFCIGKYPFAYYLSKSDGNIPKAAGLLAKDFNEVWWSDPGYEASRSESSELIKDHTSALRIEISKYLLTLDQSVAMNSDYADEIELLSNLNVDGVITTNWDLFLEELYPDYRTYIGQEELLFSNPQEVGEIYKIHGCISNFESLILTDADYKRFDDKNPYLAAKLITLFIEHPIVFIGYSMSDPNIRSILSSIASCIGEHNITKLRRNLIFVKRLKEGEEPSIAETSYTIDGIEVPLTLVSLNDYSIVYEAIDSTKRKIPAKILRLCKEQLYEIVQSQEPERQIAVVDIDQVDSKEGMEFVVGIGVAAKQNEKLKEIGYEGLNWMDLFEDLFLDCSAYGAESILSSVVPNELKRTENIVTFKYLSALGINTLEGYRKSTFYGILDKSVLRDLGKYQTSNQLRTYRLNHDKKTLDELIDSCTPENAASFIPFMSRELIDLEVLKTFLLKHKDKIQGQNPNASKFRKLACFYDRLRYGWEF